MSVADGDTITLLDSNRQQHKIRLAGIDAPEKAQPFGQRSKQHLADLAFGKDAKADSYKGGRYDRDVCTVYVNEQDIGLPQPDAGLASWFREVRSRATTKETESTMKPQRTEPPRIAWDYGRTRIPFPRGNGVTRIARQLLRKFSGRSGCVSSSGGGCLLTSRAIQHSAARTPVAGTRGAIISLRRRSLPFDCGLPNAGRFLFGGVSTPLHAARRLSVCLNGSTWV